MTIQTVAFKKVAVLIVVLTIFRKNFPNLLRFLELLGIFWIVFRSFSDFLECFGFFGMFWIFWNVLQCFGIFENRVKQFLKI